MTSIELTGWAAAALTLVAFTSRDVRRLRLASIGASVAFIVFAAATAAWPVLALHALLLPINLRRLLELRTGGQARPWRCACGGRPVLLALAMVAAFMPGEAASATHAERMHTRAVDSFRQGRFSECVVPDLSSLRQPGAPGRRLGISSSARGPAGSALSPSRAAQCGR